MPEFCIYCCVLCTGTQRPLRKPEPEISGETPSCVSISLKKKKKGEEKREGTEAQAQSGISVRARKEGRPTGWPTCNCHVTFFSLGRAVAPGLVSLT